MYRNVYQDVQQYIQHSKNTTQESVAILAQAVLEPNLVTRPVRLRTRRRFPCLSPWTRRLRGHSLGFLRRLLDAGSSAADHDQAGRARHNVAVVPAGILAFEHGVHHGQRSSLRRLRPKRAQVGEGLQVLPDFRGRQGCLRVQKLLRLSRLRTACRCRPYS